MDSVTSAGLILAIIALSDGIRVLPSSAVVIRRWPVGRWRLPGLGDQGHKLRMVSWCIPLALPLVVRLDDHSQPAEPVWRRLTRFRARQRRVRRHMAFLRLGGLLTLLALVVVLPLLIARAGAWGLASGLTIVFVLALLQSAVASLALMRVGLAVRPALLASIRFCWPFTSPRAAEDVQRRVVRDVPALVLLHELLSPDDFQRIARPLVYDALVRGASGPDSAAIVQYWGVSKAHAFIGEVPGKGGDAFCPRCGAEFYRGTPQCSDCPDVALRPAISAALSGSPA